MPLLARTNIPRVIFRGVSPRRNLALSWQQSRARLQTRVKNRAHRAMQVTKVTCDPREGKTFTQGGKHLSLPMSGQHPSTGFFHTRSSADQREPHCDQSVCRGLSRGPDSAGVRIAKSVWSGARIAGFQACGFSPQVGRKAGWPMSSRFVNICQVRVATFVFNRCSKSCSPLFEQPATM